MLQKLLGGVPVTSIQSIELEASLLRRCLLAQVPEHRILCILRFFERLQASPAVSRHAALAEGYLREFVPAMIEAATHADPIDLLPHEIVQLRVFSELLAPHSGSIVNSEDIQRLAGYQERACARIRQELPTTAKNETLLAALFVEELPELELAPRGRLLWLSVRASVADPDDKTDIIHIFNPHKYASGPLIQQAETAVGAARRYLYRHCGLAINKRYRLDFRVLPVTSRLTGNSLGIAFAVGAVIAIGKREELRESFDAQPSVAFTGAVGADGALESIDGQGLRLKLERAYHNRLNYVAIPRAHVSEAYGTVRELERQSPGHTLNVLGADTIDAILDDRNLIDRQHRSIITYAAAQARKKLNNPKVGLPVLLSLLAILAILIIPWITSRLDTNPATVEIKGKGILVKNQHGRTLWGKTYECDSLHADGDPPWKVCDLDDDRHNEILIIPPTNAPSPDNAKLHVYSADGALRFSRLCAVWDRYPGDNVPGIRYQADAVHVVRNRIGPVIVTIVSENNPSRAHIMTWTTDGDSTGWYVNAGISYLWLTQDFDSDGTKELFFTGYNVRMGASALFVLKSIGSTGASPPYQDPQYDLSRVTHGNQLHYMIFPPTDLAVALSLPYNAPGLLRRESDGQFRTNVQEGSVPSTDVNYYLQPSLTLTHVDLSDEFNAHRLKAIREGRLSTVEVNQYLAHLRDTVSYWIFKGWVTEKQRRESK